MRMSRKSLYFLLVMAVSAFCSCGRASGADFQEVYRNDGFYHIFVDAASMDDKGEYVLAWEKYVPQGQEMEKRKQEYGQKYSHRMVREAFKKKTRESQALRIIDYDVEGGVIKESRRPYSTSNYEEFPPNSIGAVLWDAVMRLSKNI